MRTVRGRLTRAAAGVALVWTVVLVSNTATAFTVLTPRPASPRGGSPAVSSSTELQLKRPAILSKLKRPSRVVRSSEEDDQEHETVGSRRKRARKRIADLARRIILSPIQTASSIAPMPKAIAAVLKDATLNAVDLAVEEGASGMFLFI